jgi:hypothetical protein
LIWPGDKNRAAISTGGADVWFWIHVAQAALFGALSLYALKRLAKLAKQGEPSSQRTS